MVTERIRVYGNDKVVVGDLVIPPNELSSNIIRKQKDEDVEGGEVEDDEQLEGEFRTNVQIVTEEDIAASRFSIFDVVLPLPGHDIRYPTNDIGQKYR
jgi:tRNA pseudouridine13 synthase